MSFRDHDYYPPVSPISAGIRGRCPRCGEGRLFKGFLDIQDRCPACDLDYSQVNSGDGPAVFVIFIVGFVVVALALWLELAYTPPIWLHMVLWIPLILILSLGLLRPFKGVLVALQYRNKASSDVELD